MKGTILDFLKLAAQKPEVAKELAALAAKHGIELSDEVSDEELESVAGGTDSGGLTDISQMGALQLQDTMQQQQQAYRTYANLLKSYHETAQTIISNMRG